MFHFPTPPYSGYSLRFSPFHDSTLAVSTAANFGLAGNGRLYLLSLTPGGIVSPRHYDTSDALFSLCFSESHSSHILVASGDGSLKLFDTALDSPWPVRNWKAAHTREVFDVNWDLVGKDVFASASWDGAVRLWKPEVETPLQELQTGSCAYSVRWLPHAAGVLSSVGSSGQLRIWDTRQPPVAVVPAPVGEGEILCHDWNKYRPEIVATGGVDRVIRTWDFRMLGKGPVGELRGHEFAVRNIAWSPHWPDVLASASYDMSVRLWSDTAAAGSPGAAAGLGAGGRLLGVMDKHTEFAAGVDWCLFGAEGWAASCGWDHGVYVFDANALMAGAG